MSRRGVLAGAGALATAACVPRSGGRGLRFWAMSYEGDYAPLLMTAFTRATGLDVDVQSVPWTAAHEKLLTAQAGGSLPDVFMLPAGWIGEFAMIGAIAPVPAPALVADLVPGVLAPARVGARTYAVPWSVAPQVQFYRRDLLAEVGYDAPPQDWAGWRRMGHALKRRRPDEFVFLMLLNWPGALLGMLFQSGARLLRDHDTRGNFRTPEARAAFAFYLSLYAEGLAPVALSTEVQDPLAAFGQGRYAIWPSGPTTLLDLSRRQAEIPPDRWGTAQLAGPRGPGPVPAINACLCVSAATAHPAAAWALVRHLTSAANELRFQRMIGTLPARASAWHVPRLAGPVIAPFAAQMLSVAPVPMVVEWERIQIEVQLVAERIVRGLTTIDQGLAAIDARVDAILAKRRALVEAGAIT
ncbi:extracellular solute-binding protein [Sphingomonas sp. A2-49]|uniref:extracellular solute-binding protein n=1 Tax=Sphingomonas sp. A2-49 TaxID=1391375 RepID=UPI0021D380AA|nr:extracellular solute-binding protein [Sphingomonas sp. A2-49]MCU6453769.1 extracellular solute-binding protein [Sphingomonas sp. A2-49]